MYYRIVPKANGTGTTTYYRLPGDDVVLAIETSNSIYVGPIEDAPALALFVIDNGTYYYKLNGNWQKIYLRERED